MADSNDGCHMMCKLCAYNLNMVWYGNNVVFQGVMKYFDKFINMSFLSSH